MTKSKRQKKKKRSSREKKAVAPARKPSTASWPFWAAGLLAILFIAFTLLRNGADSDSSPSVQPASIPPPPMVTLPSNTDPAVQEVIESAVNEVKAEPQSGEAWGKLGSVYFAYDHVDPAMVCFEQAERLDPNEARWFYYHGLASYGSDPQLALTKLEQAVSLMKGGLIAPRLRMANIHAERGNSESALNHYQSVLAREPDNAPALLGLARLALAEGGLQESKAKLLICASNQFTAKRAHDLLSAVYLRENRPDLSARASEIASSIEAEPPFPDPLIDEISQHRTGETAWNDHAEKLIREGHIARAKTIVEKCLDRYPGSAKAWLLMGRVLLAEQNFTGAESALHKAISLDPDSVQSMVQLGVAMIYQQKPDEALPVLNQALALTPDLGEAHFNKGLCLMMLSQWSGAEAAFNETIRYKPNLTDGYLGLANALQKQNKRQEALDIVNRALQAGLKDPRLEQFLQQTQQP